jgi:hypothetical protein
MGLLLGRGDPCDLVVIDQSVPPMPGRPPTTSWCRRQDAETTVVATPLLPMERRPEKEVGPRVWFFTMITGSV